MSKVDCSNIFNFVTEWERRNNDKTDKMHVASPTITSENIEKLVEDLQKWSDERPRQTRKEKFIQMCKENGFEKVIKYHSEKDVCKYPCCIFNCAECKEYWNEEVD